GTGTKRRRPPTIDRDRSSDRTRQVMRTNAGWPAIALAWLGTIGTSSQGAQGPRPPRPRDAQIQAAASEAEMLEAEFASDLLLRLSQSPRVDNDWRGALIAQSFMLAYRAQEPYRRSAFGIPPDSRQGAMSAAYNTQLTRLSLQTRATQLMAF